MTYPLDRNFGIPGPFGHGNRLPHLQIFGDATTTVGVAWEHYKLTFLCLESILPKIKDCTGMRCR